MLLMVSFKLQVLVILLMGQLVVEQLLMLLNSQPKSPSFLMKQSSASLKVAPVSWVVL